MNDKTFKWLLTAVILLGLLLTLAHLVYAIYAYQHCSIIYFIGKELW